MSELSAVSRRQFFGAAAAVVGSPSFTTPRAAKRVVVLGGGLAGLTAADDLKTAGIEVTVLEARMRPGGRVFTLRKAFVDDQYAEAGAMFIPANHKLTIELARSLRLNLVKIPDEQWGVVFHLKGQRIPPSRAFVGAFPVTLSPEEKRVTWETMHQAYVLPGATETGDILAKDWPKENLKELDQMSFFDYLKKSGASPGAIEIIRSTSYDLEGEGIESLSALHVLRGIVGSRAENDVFMVEGGNDQLPRKLAEKLGESVILGAEVRLIRRTNAGVEVSYQQNNRVETVSGDSVICTLPFSVLKSIDVQPAWQPLKRTAIDQLSYTNVTRVYLQSRTRSWQRQGLPGHAATDLPIQWAFECTGTQPGVRGIMHTYSTGRHARMFQGLSEADRIKTAGADLEKVFPGFEATVERGTSFCWDTEPYSKGGYCYFKPGQIFGLLPNAVKPDDRVYFAGEHVSPYPGWMQGAIHSGKRAAKEALAAMKE